VSKTRTLRCPECGGEQIRNVSENDKPDVYELFLEQKDDDGNYHVHCMKCGTKQKMELKRKE
jgi:transcription elongation factor Elf1